MPTPTTSYVPQGTFASDGQRNASIIVVKLVAFCADSWNMLEFIASNRADRSRYGRRRAFMLKLFDHSGPVAAAGGSTP